MVIFIMMWYNYIIKIFRKGETVMSDIITYKIADNINKYLISLFGIAVSIANLERYGQINPIKLHISIRKSDINRDFL